MSERLQNVITENINFFWENDPLIWFDSKGSLRKEPIACDEFNVDLFWDSFTAWCIQNCKESCPDIDEKYIAETVNRSYSKWAEGSTNVYENSNDKAKVLLALLTYADMSKDALDIVVKYETELLKPEVDRLLESGLTHDAIMEAIHDWWMDYSIADGTQENLHSYAQQLFSKDSSLENKLANATKRSENIAIEKNVDRKDEIIKNLLSAIEVQCHDSSMKNAILRGGGLTAKEFKDLGFDYMSEYAAVEPDEIKPIEYL